MHMIMTEMLKSFDIRIVMGSTVEMFDEKNAADRVVHRIMRGLFAQSV